MTMMIQMLEPEPAPTGDDMKVYDERAIKLAAMHTRELCNGGLLAVQVEDELHVSFAVFRGAFGPSTINGKIVDGPKVELMFHGHGPSGSLRELRHTVWGAREDGYIFDPDMSIIGAAFTALGEWFDVAGAPKRST
jgi:hypothetical protein